tara:strand:+ start:98 stop:397 length:300 start_codon:yes stop_codon:yes gene_type:complete
MKITKSQLKQLIKEELDSVRESRFPQPPPGMDQGEFFDSQQKELERYLKQVEADLPRRLRDLERKVDKIMDTLKLKKEGYPGLQGEDITTVANGPPRKK